MSPHQRAVLLVLVLAGPTLAEPPKFDRLGDPLPPGAIARLGTLRFRHAGTIRALTFAPDGKLLVSGGDDKVLCMWDTSTGLLVRKLSGHENSIHRIVFSPDGKLLATDDDSGEVRVWNPTRNEPLYRVPSRGGVPPAFSADGKRLAVLDDKGQIHIHEAVSGKELAALTPRSAPKTLALSLDGKLVAAGDGNGVRLYDTTTGKKIRTYEGYHSGCVVFSPDGKRLASGGNDSDVFVWELETEDHVCHFKTSEEASVVAIVYSPDGKTLSVATRDSIVSQRDATTGKELARYGEKDDEERWIPVLSADGTRLALAEGSYLRIRDLATGQDNPPLRQQVAFYSARWSPVPGKAGYVAALETHTGGLTLWEPTSTAEPRLLRMKDTNFSPSISADGKLVASNSEEHMTRLWDPTTGAEVRTIRLGSSRAVPLGFSPTGPTLAIEGDDVIVLVDPTTGKERLTIPDAQVTHPCPGFSGDGRILASLTRASNVLRFWEAATGQERGRVSLIAQANSVALAPDGVTAAVGDGSGGIQVYHLGREKLLRRLSGHEQRVGAVAYSPGGKLLASGSEDHTVRLWDLETGRELARLDGHLGRVNGVAFSPDGKHLLTASDDATALVWDVATVLAARPTEATPAPVRPLADLWTDLGSPDARKAFAAIAELTGRAGEVLPWFKVRLKQVERVKAEVITRLLADLDSDQFETRERAVKELRALDRLAESQVRAALEGKPSPAKRQLLDEIIAHLEAPLSDPDLLRGVRAVEVLEAIGARESLALLDDLARGAPAARLTEEARSAADRLRRRLALPR
jgi:WD40 repeat protein